MPTEYHWGVWVSSETPITGVISNSDIVQFISDELYNGIDLDYEEYVEELKNEYPDDWEARLESDFYESDGSSTYLIGDWTKDSEGLYMPDETGEYAAIVREDVTQVVWSKHTTRANLCSPCYPGQANIETDETGEYLAYTLPDEAFDN